MAAKFWSERPPQLAHAEAAVNNASESWVHGMHSAAVREINEAIAELQALLQDVKQAEGR